LRFENFPAKRIARRVLGRRVRDFKKPMNIQGAFRERKAGDDGTTGGAVAAAHEVLPDAMDDSFAETIRMELLGGFKAWRVWTILAWDDIRQRYRRSILGPFWITLSMGIFILLLGLIYSRIFHTELKTYMPFLSVGFIIWGFISTTVNESCLAFREGSRIIKQIKLPYSTYVLRVFWRNFIVFLHTIVIFVPVAIVFSVIPNMATLYALPGLLLIAINLIWISLVLGIISTRYRDIPPIVTTMVQLAIFATPIMWTVNSLGDETILAEVNPIYHLIELVRAPMLGSAPEITSWLVCGGMAVFGFALAMTLLVSKSRRIVYWL
jgi:ABC-type polysaccharide/polyol phosphate export permease